MTDEHARLPQFRCLDVVMGLWVSMALGTGLTALGVLPESVLVDGIMIMLAASLVFGFVGIMRGEANAG